MSKLRDIFEKLLVARNRKPRLRAGDVRSRFTDLAHNNPQALYELLGSGTLSSADLTFAAEAAGELIVLGERVRDILVALLYHADAVVREGVLYGLAMGSISHEHRERIAKLAESDPSPGVRQAASEVLSR